MEQRRMGATGLRVSRLGLGTMTWGRDTPADDAAAQLSAFADVGGNLVDTADRYADGDAELVVGRLLREVVPRTDLVLAAATSVDSPGHASRRHLLAALDGSLRRLGVDHVDLWQIGSWDPATPLDETLAAIDTAVGTGRARYAGVRDYAGWQLARAATWQRAWPGRAPISALQVEYSLLARSAEAEAIPAAVNCGVGVLSRSPLGRGVLTGKYRTGIPADSRAAAPHFAAFVRPYLDERGRAIVEAVATAAEGLGVSALAVALSWARDRPGVSAAIAGARTTGQLTGILESEDVTLPPEISSALSDVSAPPRGYPSAGGWQTGTHLAP